MVGFMAYVWENPDTAAELAKHPPSMADQFFDRLDANGDDFITPDEIPAQLKPFLKASPVPIPEKISRADFKKLVESFMGARRPKKKEQPKAKVEPKKDGAKRQ